MAEFSYEILKTIGVISASPKGWTRELNLVSWNERSPKYDIRDWAPDHKKMGKGISLSTEDLSALKNLLNEMEV